MQMRGSDDIVYVDESGFEPEVCRRYGWAERGQQVYLAHTWQQERETLVNLVAGLIKPGIRKGRSV